MIRKDELVEIGTFNKPHGICGEISATIDSDIELSALKCIVLDIDGIYVPFFIESFREKGAETFLLTIDGITDENEAMKLSRMTIFALKRDCASMTDSDGDDGDGMYAEDFIGYTVLDDNDNVIGRITDIDDSTENVLFIVERDNNGTVYIPVADEFIIDIDTESLIVSMSLPAGLIEL